MKRILFIICTLLCLHGVSNAQNCASAFSDSITAGSLTVRFHDASTVTNGGTITHWYWNFGDGSAYDTTQNPHHSYAAAGRYNVCLYISTINNGVTCTNQHCDSVTVTANTPPSCGIGYQYTSGPNLGQINFTSSTSVPSGSILTYTWSFGDSTTGSGANPVHSYTHSGTYRACVYVVANDSLGNHLCTASFCDSVHVSIPGSTTCQAAFTSAPVPPSNLVFAFTNSSTHSSGNVSYSWTFGDNGTSTDPSPTHTYSAAGTYSVCLYETVYDSLQHVICSSHYCSSVTAVAPTTCGVGFQFTQTPNGLVINFTATATGGHNFTYNWYPGDNTTSGVGAFQTYSHTYTAAGTYYACVYAYAHDSLGNVVCTAHYCDSVHVTASTACQAYFPLPTTTGLSAAFTGQYSSISTPGTTVYEWNFGDSTTASGLNVTHNYNHAGTYNVCLTIINTATGCNNQFCRSVTITSSTPNCTVTFTDSVNGLSTTAYATATGHNNSYTWTWGDGSSTGPITTNPSTHTYANAGRYLVCVTAYAHDSLGNVTCTTDHCDSVTVHANTTSCQAYFYAPTVSGTGATFVSNSTGVNGATTYSWTFGDSTTGTGAPVTHHYTQGGTYNVCLTITTPSNVSGGVACTSTFCRTVTIANSSTCGVAFTSTTTGLTGSFIATATANGHNLTYNWYFGDNTSSGYTPNTGAQHTYANAGTYQVCVFVQVHDSAGNVICTADHCDSITVHATTASCQAYFTLPTISGNSAAFSAQYSTGTNSTTTYTWEFGDSTHGTGISPTHTYVHSGTYNVCLTTSTITTPGASPCVSHYCRTVTITGSNTTCGVGFQYVQTPNGLVINFTASATGHNVTYDWYYGDNTTSGYGTSNTSSHTYANAGTYFACVYIQTHDSAGNVTCDAHFCDSVRVHANTTSNPCHASFAAIASAANGAGAIYFSNTSTSGSNIAQTSYTWSFGDSTFSHLSNPLHTYTASGTYHVCLTLTTYGTNGAVLCSDDTCTTVTVTIANPVPCHAAFQYTAGATNANELHFQEYSTGTNLTYTWDFGDGHSGTGHDPVHTYGAAGYYVVCLTVTDAAGGAILCTDTHCDTIQVASPVVTHCNAEFHYLQSTSVGNTLHFINNSTGTGHLTYHWTFGDGDSSSNFDPNHTYAHSGTYQVCLVIVDYNSANIATCTSHFCDSVNVISPNTNTGPFGVSGNVFNGPVHPSVNAVVYLITLDSFNLVAVDSMLAPQGQYAFTHVHAGQYLVKAALRAGAPSYSDFLPTYYGDQLFWLNGTLLTVNQNIASVDIHLQQGVNNGGPGFVGGNIFQGANKAGDPLAGFQVMILNMDNSPVQYMYSDGSGAFNFNNLAYGTYKLYTEVLGLPTEPAIFTISPTQEVGNANVLVNTDVVTFEKLTGIETVGSTITGTSLFPNPVSGSATVQFNAANEGVVTISLTNIVGQAMIERKFNAVAGGNEFTMDMGSMAPGIYILNVKDNNSKGAIFKIVKQ